MNGAYRPGTIWSVSRSSPKTHALGISGPCRSIVYLRGDAPPAPPERGPPPGAPDPPPRRGEREQSAIGHRVLDLARRRGPHPEAALRRYTPPAEDGDGLAHIDEAAVRARAEEDHVDR